MNVEAIADKVTYRINLHGRQRRMKEAILYVSRKAADQKFFGLVKLNKILWRADFRAFRERGLPVTGRQYQRQAQGPVAVDMPPLLGEMLRENILVWADTDVPRERRPSANADPNLSFFSPDDIRYLDEAIEYYRNLSATDASDDSHGVAWKVRNDGDPMPYEASLLQDAPLPKSMLNRLSVIGRERGWQSE